MAAGSRPLVIAFMADVAAAVGQITGLTGAVNGLSNAASNAAGGLGNVGGAGAAGLSAAEKALRQLGVKSEAVADAQIATLENAFRDLQNAGTASADEITRAQAAMEARIQQINNSIGRDTRTTWERIADNVKHSMGKVQGFARAGLKAGATGVVAAGAAGLAAGTATFVAVQAEAERQDELIKMARSTNTNLETLSAYAFAAEQSAVDLATLGKAFQKLRVQMEKANDPGKPIDTTGMDAEEIADAQSMDGAVLKRMGIETKTASGEVRKFDDVFGLRAGASQSRGRSQTSCATRSWPMSAPLAACPAKRGAQIWVRGPGMRPATAAEKRGS